MRFKRGLFFFQWLNINASPAIKVKQLCNRVFVRIKRTNVNVKAILNAA